MTPHRFLFGQGSYAYAPAAGNMKGKKRSEQHLIDADGAQILRERLPREWVLREYRPDYGLDYAIEVFAGQLAHCNFEPWVSTEFAAKLTIDNLRRNAGPRERFVSAPRDHLVVGYG